MYDKSSRNVIFLAGIGAVLEFYDFVLYIIFSKEISATFFAQISNPTIKAFLTVLIFSIAYLVRPFAGTVLGIVGDLIGRRRLLLFTILLMGTCSICMGLMPGYAQWGLFASFAFVVLRVMQGIALGGELPGAYVIVYESVKGKIGFATAILFTFVTCGFLFSDFVGFALEYFFGEYAWRAGFLIGGLLGLLGYAVRRNLHETPEFENIDQQKRHSFGSLISTYGPNLFAGICMVVIVAFGGVMLTLYIHKFVENILPNYNSGQISLLLTPSVLTLTCFTFIYGFLSDKIGIAKMFITGAALIVVCVLPIFYFMSSVATPFAIMTGSIAIMLCYALVAATFVFLLCDLFPTDVRLSGVGISYNLAFAMVGGVAPLVSTTIITMTEYNFLGPALVGIVCGCFGLIGVFTYFKKGGYYKNNKDMIVKL
ncbi:MFS transporter [Candidatus Francisella endociliophora]|uniref:MFS transporter n=1 Tax=Candidatus Francisella endociliophora TaxID=653937 RepID=A0A097EMY2_9GAMM|nr:MFS transporter [Francisella sp. FSC1006]AIT08926.1 MFS transporter [Francisella sp. FSC1006]